MGDIVALLSAVLAALSIGIIAYYVVVTANVEYRQWKPVIAWCGGIEYVRGDTDWGGMERHGLESE